ncbi:MAG: glycoside hydrolase family 3 N-terminal domain-containing protein [Candidatus Izemoplasmataceae bacterium]
MKFLWRNKATRIWLIVTSSIMTLLIIASLTATQIAFLRGTLNIVFGGDRAIIDGDSQELYIPDYDSKASVLEAARNFNITIAEEGFVLLKNDNNALPLNQGSRLSIFGKNSEDLVYGGSGSGAGSANLENMGLHESLTTAGFELNPVLKAFYEDNARSGLGRPRNPSIGDIIAGFATGETPMNSYDANIRSSYAEYNDAAIVLISRIGGEGFDLPRTMADSYSANANKISGANNLNDHYLQLDANESLLLLEVYEHFNKVILLLNTPSQIELGFIDDEDHPLYSEKLEAVLWIGMPGSTGAMAIGPVLNGDVNPSGRTTNIYARDFRSDPTWFNFGNNNVLEGNRYTVNGQNQVAYFVEYQEGIYIGYRYYETRGYTDGEIWYKNNVVFPFGFGLSYTTFDWNIESKTIQQGSYLAEDDVIIIEVTVTNTGGVAGKDVVQLYYTSPYTPGGIEKAHVVLGAFEKTDIIQPRESQTVTLSIPVEMMKSYDYNDANDNGFKGYELEAGEYIIHLSRNSNEVVESMTYQVAETIFYDVDSATGYKVENLFDDVSDHLANTRGYLTRNGWTNFPTTPTIEEREISQMIIDAMIYNQNDAGKPWFEDVMTVQASRILNVDDIYVTFEELIGRDYQDPLWDLLLNQLTVEQMARLIGNGAFNTIPIENIGKPLTRESDGPSGFTNFMATSPVAPVYDTNFYPSQSLIGATWSKDIAYEMGIIIGNEALIGNERGDGLPYSGWYAPGVNLHRSPFSGRNWEYYSEDPILSGILAANVIQGAAEKGVYTFVKHFAVNDQETNRDTNGLLVWVDEQTMRELYFKPFEIAVKEGETTAMMSAFNRLGTTWTGGSYALLTELLRNEWGFKGMVITDYALNRYLNEEQMIRAGGDLALTQGGKIPNYDDPSPTQVSVIRQATKNILYTVVNSNAMNLNVIGYRPPLWTQVLLGVNLSAAVGFGTWGFYTIKKTLNQ